MTSLRTGRRNAGAHLHNVVVCKDRGPSWVAVEGVAKHVHQFHMPPEQTVQDIAFQKSLLRNMTVTVTVMMKAKLGLTAAKAAVAGDLGAWA